MADAVSRCGGVFLVSPTQTRAHRHPELECNLVTRGSARYVVGDQRYDLGPGTLLWLFPGQEHALVQQSSDLQLWLAFFHRPVLTQASVSAAYRPLLERDPPGAHCRTLSEASMRQLRPLLELVSKHLDDEVQLSVGLAHLAVTAWALHLAAPPGDVVSALHPAVSRAAHLLRVDASASLTEIAATTGVSASRLRHLFHQQTGSTLVSYRNRQRLHRFIDQHSHRRSLLEQSLHAGFGSYAQFHRVFRALMGASPQAWLQQR